MKDGHRPALLWAVPARGVRGDCQAGRTLAAFLSDMPVRRVGWPDASLSTHRRVRCLAPHWDERTHDVTRFLATVYVTRCGVVVNKTHGVLTADTADCKRCVRSERNSGDELAETKTPAAGTCNPGGRR